MRLPDIFHKLKHKKPGLKQIFGFAMRHANYRFGFRGKALPPLRIFINLNNRCNAKCKQCDVGQDVSESLFRKTMVQDGTNELSMETLEKIFQEIAPHRPLIAFNGVEPTLSHKLVPSVRSASSKGMKTQVTTNGILLPRLSEGLLEAGLDSLWVSIDGLSETHDAIRGVPGAFKKAMDGLRDLYNMKLQRGGKRPSLNIISTIFHLNQTDIFEFMKFLEGCGIHFDEILIQHLQFITPEQASLNNRFYPSFPTTAISTEHSSPHLVDINQIYRQMHLVESARFKLNIRWKPCLRSISEMEKYYRHSDLFIGEKECRAFWNELQILADGSVTGSQRCFTLALGNVNTTPFMDLWNGPGMTKWRKFLKKEGALPACSRCCSIL